MSIFDDIGSGLSDFGGGIADETEALGTWTKETAVTAADELGTTAGDVKNLAVTGAGDAENLAVAGAEDVKTTAVAGAEDVKNEATSIAEDPNFQAHWSGPGN